MIEVKVSPFVPQAIKMKAAILLYGTDNETTYATHHTVKLVDGHPQIMAGSALSLKRLQNYAHSLAKTVAATDEFLDEHVLANRPGFIAWWRKPQRTRLWFKSSDLNRALIARQHGRLLSDDVDDLMEKEGDRKVASHSIEVALPGMVFMVCQGHLYVSFVKGDGRPNRDTQLYHTSLMNVWHGGEVCTGNVALPKLANSATTQEWEAVLFKSHFTHFNGATDAGYNEGRMGIAVDLVNGVLDSIPEASFSAMNLTVKEAINAFIKRK